MKPAGTHVVALALALVFGGCDVPRQESAAPPAATEPPPGVVEYVPPTGQAPFLVQLASGKWCQGEADEIFFDGDDKLCSTILNIRMDEALAAPHRRASMKLTYHQPGPVTDDGKTVGWSESDMRFNCETGEIWVLDITTHGADGVVIVEEPQDPPRKLPGGSNLLAVICNADI